MARHDKVDTVITREMIDFIYSECDKTDGYEWNRAFDDVILYCDRWVAGKPINQSQIDQILFCYNLLTDQL